eukprot:s251_g33.t1
MQVDHLELVSLDGARVFHSSSAPQYIDFHFPGHIEFAMPPFLDSVATSRAGMLLSMLPPPIKPDLLEEDDIPASEAMTSAVSAKDLEKEVITVKSDSILVAADFELTLKSPRNSFHEDWTKSTRDYSQPLKPDRSTHDGYVRELEARLQAVHRAPKKLSRAVKWRRHLDFCED